MKIKKFSLLLIFLFLIINLLFLLSPSFVLAEENKPLENNPPAEETLEAKIINVLEVRLMMDGDSHSQEKCQICHSIKAPLTGSDFYSEGRYCPSCDRPMHLSCAAMWARKSESLKNIFRCPFCFFLLELPKIALKFVEEKEEEPQEIKILAEKSGFQIVKTHNLLQPAHWALSIQNVMQNTYFKSNLKNGRSFYFTPLLMLFLPVNLLQIVLSKTSLVEFVFKKV